MSYMNTRLIVCLCGFVLPAACLAGGQTADLSKIQHIVFIVKENRSFDNFFGTFPGADGATTGTLSTGQVIPLGHAEDQYHSDLGHDPSDFVVDYDGGKMDGFDIELNGNFNGDYLALTQQYEADLPNYWQYAQYFTLGDRMFSSFAGPSFPAHLYTLAAQSGEVTQLPIIPGHVPPASNIWGCDAVPSTVVKSEDPQGIHYEQFPCVTVTTMADLLNNAGISWKSYAPTKSDPDYWWNTFDAIRQIRFGPQWTTNVVPVGNFATDALNGNLPAVSWLSTGVEDDHPPHSLCLGENWTVEQVNAVMQGPDWDSTVIFIVWDDWGGLYDHVPPPQVDQFGFGSRVPFLIISPYARSGKILHTTQEFSSILKFIETRFGLPSLTSRDKSASNLLGAFNFSQAPLPPLILGQRICPLIAQNSFFGNWPIGSTSTANPVNLLNNRATPLTISKMVATGDYSVASTTCKATVQPAASCLVNIVFSPTAPGSRPGSVTITDSDGSSPQVISLIGTGSELAFNNISTYLPDAPLGTSSTRPLTLTNVGANPLTISSLVTGREYSQTNNCPGKLASGASCTAKISFNASTDGIRRGILTVTDSGAGSPHTSYFTATAVAITTTPSTLNFGTVSVGTQSVAQIVNVQSYANPLLIGSISVPAPFSQSNNCPAQLPLKESCQITVTFNPTAAGAASVYLQVPSSDVMGPNTIQVQGVGQ